MAASFRYRHVLWGEGHTVDPGHTGVTSGHWCYPGQAGRCGWGDGGLGFSV